MAENFPNLRKETEIKIQDTEFQIRWTQRDLDQDIKIKMAKITGKERILKPSKEKQLVIIHTRELP